MNSTIAIASKRMPKNFTGLRAIETRVEQVFVIWTLGCACGGQHGEIHATPSRDDLFPFLDPVTFVCGTLRPVGGVFR